MFVHTGTTTPANLTARKLTGASYPSGVSPLSRTDMWCDLIRGLVQSWPKLATLQRPHSQAILLLPSLNLVSVMTCPSIPRSWRLMSSVFIKFLLRAVVMGVSIPVVVALAILSLLAVVGVCLYRGLAEFLRVAHAMGCPQCDGASGVKR